MIRHKRRASVVVPGSTIAPLNVTINIGLIRKRHEGFLSQVFLLSFVHFLVDFF